MRDRHKVYILIIFRDFTKIEICRLCKRTAANGEERVSLQAYQLATRVSMSLELFGQPVVVPWLVKNSVTTRTKVLVGMSSFLSPDWLKRLQFACSLRRWYVKSLAYCAKNNKTLYAASVSLSTWILVKNSALLKPSKAPPTAGDDVDRNSIYTTATRATHLPKQVLTMR